MWRILRLLFTGRWILPPVCFHQWQAENQYTVVRDDKQIGVVHVLKCSKCGDIKSHLVSIYG